MTPQQLQSELRTLLVRESLKPRRVMIVRDSIRRLETYLYRRRLNYRYGILVRGRRIFIADKRTQNVVNEIGLDIATGATTGRSFVYNIIVLGGEDGSAPRPLELNKGGSRHGSSHRSDTRRERSTFRPLVRY